MIKGNKFNEGLKMGRPPVFDSPKQLEEIISKYFNQENIKFTITGLCLFCGFESRQSFYDYEKNKNFSYIIKRARLVIENMYEENLQENNAAGSIFALKNMGWADKQELEHSGGGEITIVRKVIGTDKKKTNE